MANEKLNVQAVTVSHIRAPLPKPAAVSNIKSPAVDIAGRDIKAILSLEDI